MFDLAIVLVLLAAAIVMFAINKPRMDAVALIMLTALPFTGVITMGEALAGFSDPNIVLIAALFVIGDGLVRTGVARRLGDWLTAKAGSSEVRLIVLLMMVVCGLGATMSSTAVTAIFIPVALRISQSTGIGAEPADDAAQRRRADQRHDDAGRDRAEPGRQQRTRTPWRRRAFSFFSFTPFGLPILVLGIIYMIFARRWLPRTASEEPGERRPSFADWIEEYKLAEPRTPRPRDRLGRRLSGKTLEELNLRDTSGASIVAIERSRRFSRELLPPDREDGAAGRRHPACRSVRARHEQQSRGLATSEFALEAMPLSGAYFTDRSQEIGMAEVIVPPTSELVGKTIVGPEFRTRFGLTVIGLRRGTVAFDRRLLAREAEGRRHAAA